MTFAPNPFRRSAASTLTTYGRYCRGEVLQIDTGPDAEAVKVLRCAGDYPGPFTLAVRRVTWLDRAWWWLRRYPRRWRRRARDWRLARCAERFCWRRGVFEDVEWDDWCQRHAGGKELRHGAD